jgi:hypothetical protein
VTKFVCGSNPSGFSFIPPSTLVALADYKTAINVHNPNNAAIPFRYKVAFVKLYQDGDISGFGNSTIGPDAAQAFDCNLFPTLFNPVLIGVVFDGFFVIESDLPLDVVGYYSANHNGIAIHLEKSRERDMSRSPLCRQNLHADLSVAGNWLRSDGNPAVPVPPFITPGFPMYSWDSNRLWMSYGKPYLNAPAGYYSYELKFCSCSQSSVTVNGTIKSDDAATASLNSLSVITFSPSFAQSSPAASMTGTMTFAGQGSLIVIVHNSSGPTGLSVTGILNLADGYLGACKN